MRIHPEKSATLSELSLFQIYAYHKFFKEFQFNSKMIIQRKNKETLQFLKQIEWKKSWKVRYVFRQFGQNGQKNAKIGPKWPKMGKDKNSFFEKNISSDLALVLRNFALWVNENDEI